MKNRIKDIIMVAAIIFGGFYLASPVQAVEKCTGVSDVNCNEVCDDSNLDDQQKAAAGCTTSSGAENMLPTRLMNILTVAMSIVGLLSVLVIVVAGQRYIVGGGDPGKVKQAKDMILYALIALIVSGLAFAIVTFVSGAITSDANRGV
jgi:hypothetical protein